MAGTTSFDEVVEELSQALFVEKGMHDVEMPHVAVVKRVDSVDVQIESSVWLETTDIVGL